MVDINFLIIACLVTFIGSWIGTLVGGGGLLVTPVLLLSGLPVPVVLGSRRFSVIGGTLAGMIQFHRWKKVDWKLAFYFSIFCMIGAVIGFTVIDSLNELLLKRVIGVIIIGTLIFLMVENNEKVQKLKGHLLKYHKVLGPLAAIFAAVIGVTTGGAAGVIITYILIIFYGNTILQASGTRKLPLIAGSIVASCLFIYKGYIHWLLAISMFVAHALGGWFGSRFYLKKGDEKVRTIFYIICFIVAISLFVF